jgi:inhibitor of cysteine peptidase
MKLCHIAGIIILVMSIGITGCTNIKNDDSHDIIQNERSELPESNEIPTNNSSLSMKDRFYLIQQQIDSDPPIILVRGRYFEISLEESPTTGFSWNATVSNGLQIIEDLYQSDKQDDPKKGGGGGVHFWKIMGLKPGNQTFSAIYLRPWEPVNDANPSYMLRFTVVEN